MPPPRRNGLIARVLGGITHVAHWNNEFLRCLDARRHRGIVCYGNKKRHTEDNSPKYRMVGNDVVLESPTYRSFKFWYRDFCSSLRANAKQSSETGATHVALCDNIGSYFRHWCGAFTLAEVLITLGIIGVVAAMTMPALIENHKKTEYSSKLKKFNSVMQQAILMSEQDNGDCGEWGKDGGIQGDIKDEDGNNDFNANATVTEKFINTYLKPYIKIVSIKTLSNSEVGSNFGESYMVFEDGSYVYIHNGNCVDFVYDVNGPKPPNVKGRDAFHYLLCPNEKCQTHTWYTGKCGKFTFNGMKSASRAQALEKCKTTPSYCTELLEMDNYEFRKDYPYKL